MAIRIIDEGDIWLTEGERARLYREWQKCCAYSVSPPTFEDFVRSRKAVEQSEDTLRKMKSAEHL